MRPGGVDVGGSHPSDSDDDEARARISVFSAKIRTRVNYIIMFFAKASENMGLEVEKASNNYY